MVEKYINVYPYAIFFDNLDENEIVSGEYWKNRFKKEKIQDNIVKFSSYYLALIIDEDRNNQLFGRFLKLRFDAPTKINETNGEESLIEILENEYITETSHFIINLEDLVLISQYNFFAIKHFSTSMPIYLKKLFQIKYSGDEINEDDEREIRVEKIENLKVLEEIKKEVLFKSVSVKIADTNLKEKEKKQAFSIFQSLDYIGNNGMYFNLKISKSRKKDSELDSEIIKNLAVENYNNSELQEFKIESENAVYDLIGKNIQKYFIVVDFNDNRFEKSQLYDRLSGIYSQKINLLKRVIRRE